MRIKTLCAGGAGALLLAATLASAQTTERHTLTLDAAHRVVAAAIEQAKKDQNTGVIAVVDDGGNTMLVERLDNTFAAGANISIGKARTAALFKKPTKFFEELIRNGRTPMVALNDFTPLTGGVPIVIDGQIVGAVGVSGASSANADEQLAIAGANALSGDQASMASASAKPAADVLFFPAGAVSDSFAKGAILFDGQGANYQIHTSRRDKAGQVEIHRTETDVIYVLDGQATFVTGGKVTDGREIAPNEIRGADVHGGNARQIQKGDVIVVPAGVPHWFRDVPGTLKYYVVKVKN